MQHRQHGILGFISSKKATNWLYHKNTKRSAHILLFGSSQVLQFTVITFVSLPDNVWVVCTPGYFFFYLADLQCIIEW